MHRILIAFACLSTACLAGDFVVTDHGSDWRSEFTVTDHGSDWRKAEPQAPQRQIVYVWTTTQCPPCAWFHREEGQFPWVEFRDGWKAFDFRPEVVPHFAVMAEKGKWWEFSGYQGAEWFRGMLRQRGVVEPTIRNYRTVQDAAAAPTPMEEVNRVLDLLPRPEIGYVDYGAGDGRWLIAAAYKWPGVRITGIEIDPARAAATRERIRNEGLSGQVTVITGDATAVDVAADVGTMYLYPDVLENLRPRLGRLKAWASYMHAPSGFATVKNGDTFFYSQPVAQPQPRAAVWQGQVYYGPVCNNPACGMCAEIRRQLGQ